MTKFLRLATVTSLFLGTLTLHAAPGAAEVSLKPGAPGPVVNPNIYGHFAEHLGRCIYEGFWVGVDSEIPNTRGIRNDVVAALRELNIPVLRWPGGCFADEYHWKNGIGPREKRPSMINTHWGGVVENNHFGTHEFFDLCEQLGTQPYVCGNVGSGSVEEMMEWVEYMTSDAQAPMPDLRRKQLGLQLDGGPDEKRGRQDGRAFAALLYHSRRLVEKASRHEVRRAGLA